MRIVVVGIFMVILLTGCGILRTLKQDDSSKQELTLVNPEVLHDAAPLESHTTGAAVSASASMIPVTDYYRALLLAQTSYGDCFDANGKLKTDAGEACLKHRPRNLIQNYQEEGIALVDAYCRRWFQLLAERERFFNFEQQNWNVIKQLGTTLLGLGGANSAIVALYGGVNTANDGLQDNYRSAFFFSPSVSKVKQLVLAGMKDYAANLRDSLGNKGFKQVYTELESYADSCTFNSIRTYVSDSVNIATLVVGPSGGLEVRQGVGNNSPEELVSLFSEAQARVRKDKADRELAFANEEYNRVQAEVVQKQADLDRIKGQLPDLTKVQADAQQQFGQIQRELEDARKAVTARKGELDVNREDEGKQKDYAGAQALVSKKEKELTQAQIERDRSSQAVTANQAAIARLTEELSQAKKRLEEATANQTSKKNAADLQEKELQAVRAKRK